MNRFNEVSRTEELDALKRNDLMAILKNHKENGKKLPDGWSKLKDEELRKTILGIEGDSMEEKEEIKEVTNKVSTQNPFGEEIIETVIPIDQLNPKMRTVQVTVNFKPLLFPIGKPAKMPKSYYEAYMYSLNKDTQTAMRLQANRMKEV